MDLKQAHEEILSRDISKFSPKELHELELLENIQRGIFDVLGFFLVPPQLLFPIYKSTKLSESVLSVVHVYYINSQNDYYYLISNSFDDGDSIEDILALGKVEECDVPFTINPNERILELIASFDKTPSELKQAILEEQYELEAVENFPAAIGLQKYAVSGWKRRYKPSSKTANIRVLNSLKSLIDFFEIHDFILYRELSISTKETRYNAITDFQMKKLAGFVEIPKVK